MNMHLTFSGASTECLLEGEVADSSVEALERVQIHATKLVYYVRHMRYSERLKV